MHSVTFARFISQLLRICTLFVGMTAHLLCQLSNTSTLEIAVHLCHDCFLENMPDKSYLPDKSYPNLKWNIIPTNSQSPVRPPPTRGDSKLGSGQGNRECA